MNVDRTCTSCTSKYLVKLLAYYRNKVCWINVATYNTLRKWKDNLQFLCHPFCLDNEQYILAMNFMHDIQLFKRLQGNSA